MGTRCVINVMRAASSRQCPSLLLSRHLQPYLSPRSLSNDLKLQVINLDLTPTAIRYTNRSYHQEQRIRDSQGGRSIWWYVSGNLGLPSQTQDFLYPMLVRYPCVVPLTYQTLDPLEHHPQQYHVHQSARRECPQERRTRSATCSKINHEFDFHRSISTDIRQTSKPHSLPMSI